MKYSFDYSRLPDYVLITTGQFAIVDDFYKLLKDLVLSPKWQTGTPILIDHRAAVSGQQAPGDVEKLYSIYEFNAERLGGSKCALLFAAEDGPWRGLFEKPDQFSSLRFFNDRETARDWLLNRL